MDEHGELFIEADGGVFTCLFLLQLLSLWPPISGMASPLGIDPSSLDRSDNEAHMLAYFC